MSAIGLCPLAAATAARLLLGAIVCLGPAAVAAEYRLSVGDILEVSAVGIPELRQRAQINQDGDITLPLAGPLHVDGLTLSEVRRRVQQVLPTKEFRRRTETGREYPVILASGDIDVSIAQYRPVYLNGDVAKPGEQPYRPGLTLRQAIALAGGYDVLRFRMNNPFLERADLKSEYNSLWAEYAKEQLHVARLQSELHGRSDIDRSALRETPLPANVKSRIDELEAEKMKTRNADYSKERSYLNEAVAKEDGRISILTQQQDKERAGVQVDAEDLQRLQDIYQKGNVPIGRVVEARRSLLLSSTRQLQTAALLAQVERDRQEFSRKSGRLDDQRRLELLDELQTTNVKLAGLAARLEAAGEKLVYVGMVRSQLVRGKGSNPDLVIYRRNDDRSVVGIAAAEDAELAPGDVAEISLQGDMIPGLPAQ